MNEIKNIKKDLWKILILDIIIFGIFIVLYYFDQKDGIMQKLAEKIVNYL